MKVALFGGTGFVGSYLVDTLLAHGHTPRLLVRSGSESKVVQRERCEIVPGDIEDAAAVAECLAGADAVIYNIGLLREFPAQGITWEKMHYEGVVRVVDAAGQAGVRRFILMSANGVKPEGTGYQSTKYRAEQ
ncbi:MAG: NAD(P)H-binding protein, partial [Gammaproteobacteria bacterium]